MRLFLPRISLVAVMSTVFATPVLTAAPETAAPPSTPSAKIVWQIGKEDQADYRWNLEVAVQAESYLANCPQRDDFLRLTHDGKIGVMALYANTLAGLCSHATACHLFQWAADLHRQYGVRFGQTAMLNDVPSAEASLPMIDPATGGIASLIDKETGRELVVPQAPYKLNEYLYVAGGRGGLEKLTRRPITGDMTVTTPHDVTLRKMTLGPLGEMMVVESSATMTPKLRATVIAWNNTKRIDIENTLDKKLTYDLEAGYFAFPFAARNPAFRYEIPVGIVNPATDMLPGACLNWFAIQHFAEVSGKEGTVVWATPDAPMACFQDIVRGEWKKTLPLLNGTLYSYAFNNYWQTNYRAGQEGTLDFRFAITSRPASDPAASARFGSDVSNPLLFLVAGPNPNGSFTSRAASFLGLAEPNAQLIEVRQANDGAGTIVRLWETAGKDTTAHLDVQALGVKKASACNLVEDGSTPLECNQRVVAVPLHAHGVATVRLE